MQHPFSFRPDQKLTDVLKSKPFTLSAEIIPPRNGTEQLKVLRQIEVLIGAGAQFLAVTKGSGGSLRGGSLPIAQVVKEKFSVPCIAHFTCRDLLPFEIENQLMDHHYFGIRNILALRGDPPNGQPQWCGREGGYNYAHQLIAQIQNLNQGIYLDRPHSPKLEDLECTEFCIGAAAYPDHPDEQERIHYFQIKVLAGATFGITDMLFNPESYSRFLELCDKNNIHIPILPGTRLLRTRAQAERILTRFKVNIPSNTLNRLPEKETPDSMDKSLEIFLQLADQLKHSGAPGIHLYVVSDAPGASSALRKLTEHSKSC
jgi:methylenetetrahydrofolate reductase (NADPH)